MTHHSHNWSALALFPASLLAGSPNSSPLTSEDDFNTLYSTAERTLKNNQPGEALKLFSDLEKKSANTQSKVRALFLIQKANCYYQQKDWKNTVIALREFLEKFPKGTEDLLGVNDNKVATCQFTLAETYRQLGQWDSAIEMLQRLSANLLLPAKDRSTACRLAASYIQEKVHHGSSDEKVGALQQATEYLRKAVSVGLNTPEGKLAGAALVEAYIAQRLLPAAQSLQAEMEAIQSTSPAEIIRLNQLRQTQGDAYFSEANQAHDATTKYSLLRTALQAYQSTLPKLSILSQFQSKSTELQSSIAELTRLSPQPSPPVADKIRTLQFDLQELTAAESAVQQSPDYDHGIYYRIGLCLHGLNMPLEAIVAFQEILNCHPLSTQAPSAAYFIILNLVETGKTREAQCACRSFIEHYPDAKEIPQVAILLGSLAQDRQDYRDTIAQYQWAKTKLKKLRPEVLEEIEYRCCFATFCLTEWTQANEALTTFIKKYPKSKALEQVIYLRALTQFYQGKNESALNSLGDYQTRFPNGAFVFDVQYRQALIEYGKIPGQFEGSRLICEKWLKDFAGQNKSDIKSKVADVYVLIGDCEAGLAGEVDLQLAHQPRSDATIADLEKQKSLHSQRSIDAYILAARNGRFNADALRYALSKLRPALKAQNNFTTLRDLYLELYRWDKQSPQASNYLFEAIIATEWINNHAPQTGAPEPALQLLVSAIHESLNDPKQGGTEKLLTLLANKVYLKNRNLPDGATRALGELETILKPQPTLARPIAQARLYFTQAQLCALRHESNQSNQYYKLIAQHFSPSDLSATLLALTGDNALASGDLTTAEKFFDFLIQNVRTSEYADYGFAGLATIRLQQKNYSAALSLSSEALKNNFVNNKECSLRLVHGQALTELRQFTEAKKEFECVAQTKAWRGESTARSLYWLGIIEERQNRAAEAIAYYRRCYQGWKRYPEWSAKAYWGTAQLLAKQLHQPQEATVLINEMLSHDFIKETPEAHDAQNLLSAL